MEINRKEIKKLVKKILSERSSEIKESDLLFKKKSEWIEAKSDMRKDLIDLLKNIESDDYEDGVDKIDDVISSLKSWKSKIQKQLTNGK